MQRAGLAFLAISVITFGVVNIAGATGPAEGDSVPDSAQAVGSFTAGTPFSSGQDIDVVVPANGVFTPNQDINILECSAPNGVIPTNPSACDGNTINGETLNSNSDGSLDYQSDTGSLFTVYALPDKKSLDEGPSGTPCGDTAATECILYIGVEQSDFTQPHVWSQPFFITANGVDTGANPGDGSAATAPASADPAQSTVVVTPPTVVADGEDSSLVTVTLLGTSGASSGIPISGKTVTLSQGSGHSTIVPAATPNVTDENGKATFTVTDSTAESVTYTAQDTTDGITASSTASQPTVTFQAPTVSTVGSKVSATPTSVPAGDMTTITVTLRDQAANPQPVANKAVTLAGTGSTVVITSGAGTPNMTNAQGEATFIATDSATEPVTFTATDMTDSIVLTSTATVTFGTLVVSPSQSTVAASSPAEAGASTGSKVVVTLLTSNGDPVPGKGVTLSASSATASIAGPTPTETDTNGEVSFVVTDSAPESVTLTAVDSTDTVTLTTTSSITFQPAAASASASTVTDPNMTVAADGQTQTPITVTINDQFGNPLSGKTVTLAADTGSSAQSHPIAIGGSSTPGVTNSSGQVQFEASDAVAEVVKFTATDSTDTLLIIQTVSVTFKAGSADPTSRFSTVAAVPTNPPADGTTTSTVTVTLADFQGNPVSGETVALTALNGTSVITTVNATTGSDGTASFTVTDSTAEVVTYQATDVTDANTVLTQQAVVTFGNPPVPPPVATFCSVVATPASVPADGSTTATISVLLYDGNGDAVPGKTVTLTASGGNSTVTTVNGTSDNSGNALFTVTDSSAETVTYTAADTTDNVNLTGLPVTVDFTTASGTTTTTTSPTTTTTTTTAGSTTTTTSSPTTTTTPDGSSTTSTTSAVSTSPGSSDGGSSDGSTTDGSGSSSLAFTGVSTFLPWLIGIGVLLLGIGTIGRRRFQVAR